ncbi:MAG: cob(I)yrinic acid a,c-diamide adenosyltransferase [Bryobacteraceae bacterium]
MSIATKRGDGGETGLAGGIRVPKTHPRVEAYGTLDELISTLGFARSICAMVEIRDLTKSIQRELFSVGSALATPPESKKTAPEITDAMVDRLTAEVNRLEAVEGILLDWSIPGEDPASAAYDVARTVCRRAERLIVGLPERGVAVQPNIIRYVNRLSDLLWLIGRWIDLRAGQDGRLREEQHPRARWSRAW